MQIKRFRAQDMAEALRLVKKEVGYQAVILSAKEMKNGAGGMLGFLKGPCVEVTAATDTGYLKDKNENSKKNKNYHIDFIVSLKD